MSINKGTTCVLLVMIFFVLSMNSWCEYGEAARIFLDFSTSTQGVISLPFLPLLLISLRMKLNFKF
uniref:Uncharacterized protein n=1 Tax=Solanum tuberosum TaxID=4113 RepID=M1AD97_SOLTU